MKSADLMTEDMLQVYTADVLRSFAAPGVVWWHTPNGRKRHIHTAKTLKKHGTRPGIPDIIALVPGMSERGTIGFLELKDADGRQSEDQQKFQRDVEAQGHPYQVARTPEEVDGFLSGIGAIIKPVSRGTLPHGRGASGRAGSGKVTHSRSLPSTSSPGAGGSGQ